MRIGIDARMIFMSGIGTYLKNLIGGFARLETGNEFVIFIQRVDRDRFVRPDESFSVVEVEAPPYTLAEQVRLARALKGEDLDLIHHPHYAAPLLGRTPMVATIHDLIHQLFPEMCPSRLAWRVSWFMARRTARRARLLLTVSEHSRRDIVAHLGVPPEKVRLTYNALPPGWGEGISSQPLPEMDATGGAPYFLYVGNHKSHKNIPLLLEAFMMLRKQTGGVRLVLTGERNGWEKELARLRLGDEVVFLGDVSHEALQGVYASACALVFPSRYEGFGYPPLEAMGCGTPAVVSNAASLPEVVGEAGVIVPEGEAGPLRDEMLRLLSDKPHRKRLAEKSLEQAKKFSWQRLAEGTLRAYQDAVAGKDGRVDSAAGGTV